jgi:HAD superfamily 5'-nucleotidase-like hydrolase
LRSIQAIGFDMDYTLVHYFVENWERHCFEHARANLAEIGLPVENLEFDPNFGVRGLIIDRELGNLIKANRFGYVHQAAHGTDMLSYSDTRRAYKQTIVSLSDSRYEFLNTFFSISEACLYAQLVDRLDAGELRGSMGYSDLYQVVRSAIDQAHIEGEMKEEIMAMPEKFVDVDPNLSGTLEDLKTSGKKLLLITNSGWKYSQFMMNFVLGSEWRQYFDMVIVAAGKPAFFLERRRFFEVVDDDGLLRPLVGGPKIGGTYHGGNAMAVEKALNIDGAQFLYVGDHIYGDVNVSKSVLRWRTALILRELEEEIASLDSEQGAQRKIASQMLAKETLEQQSAVIRLQMQKAKIAGHKKDLHTLRDKHKGVMGKITKIDLELGPVLAQQGERANPRWSYLLRTGNDKSHLMRQIERYADIYTSRVSNLGPYTPYAYFRSSRVGLPHDGLHLEGSS